MIYAYIRVSSVSQKIDRQYEEVKKLNIDDDNIFIDKESGANFERPQYKSLLKILKKDDLLIIKSIDRLGRNYLMIIEEWRRITKVIQAHIRVIDIPLLNTKIEGNTLVGQFISDIVLQLLSFVAENERNNIKERQAEGIKIAKEKGVKFGRPKIVLAQNEIEIIDSYIKKEISNKEAINNLDISRATFFKLVSERKKSLELL